MNQFQLLKFQDTWPAPLYDLLFYIAYMSHTGLSASTITTYISGISTMHKLRSGISVPRWSASGQRFRKRCQSQRDNESAILFEIPEICKALIIIL
jgi:hypothetical protein